MSTIASIDQSLCDRSPACPAKRACPQQAITQEKGQGILSLLAGRPLSIDGDKCTGCGRCVAYCRKQAVHMASRG